MKTLSGLAVGLLLLPFVASANVLDYEIYNSAGQKISQVFTTAPSGTTCTWAYPTSGTLKIGEFTDGWASLVSWNDNAGTVTSGGDGTFTCAGAPTFSTSVDYTGQVANSEMDGMTHVRSNQDLTTAQIDTELYNSAGTKVGQFYFTGAAAPTFACRWFGLSPNVGTYTIKVGIFSHDWSTLYHWNDGALTVALTPGQNPAAGFAGRPQVSGCQ